MEIDLSPAEAAFLVANLRRHAQNVENELARTSKHELQHALARDLELLQKLVQRFERASNN
jgi:hypothetical protein